MLADVFWGCQLNQKCMCQTWRSEIVRKPAPLISLTNIQFLKALGMCRRVPFVRKHLWNMYHSSHLQRVSSLSFLKLSMELQYRSGSVYSFMAGWLPQVLNPFSFDFICHCFRKVNNCHRNTSVFLVIITHDTLSLLHLSFSVSFKCLLAL